jgi:hypothetical protein
MDGILRFPPSVMRPVKVKLKTVRIADGNFVHPAGWELIVEGNAQGSVLSFRRRPSALQINEGQM